MVRPAKRSRSIRHISRKAAGGRVVRHFVEKKPKKSHCSATGASMQGVPRQRPLRMRKMPKSSKRPERPYGGVLSSVAMRRVIIRQARSQATK